MGVKKVSARMSGTRCITLGIFDFSNNVGHFVRRPPVFGGLGAYGILRAVGASGFLCAFHFCLYFVRRDETFLVAFNPVPNYYCALV